MTLEWLAGEFGIANTHAADIVQLWARVEHLRHLAFGRPTKKGLENVLFDDVSIEIMLHAT